MKNLLAFAAAGEGALGLALLVYPPIVVRLLCDAEVTGAGVVACRVAGISLIALGRKLMWPAAVVHAVLTILLARAYFRTREEK
jgi:predicted membrane protein